MSALVALVRRLRLPLVAAPMTGVSGPGLVVAACRAGVVGSFPTHNAPAKDLDRWLDEVRAGTAGGASAPWAANLVVHRSNARLGHDLAALARHGAEVVITSVGSPAEAVGPLHDAGALVLADVASMRHAERAVAAGADGLVLLSAGAGGQTGWANPLAFVRAARDRWDVPLVLAGGVSDGAALWAAVVAGCDLAYMGTRFIATRESLADEDYRQLLVRSTLDDVTLTTAATGIPSSIVAETLRHAPGPEAGGTGGEGGFSQDRLGRRTPLRSAGHSVSGVTEVLGVAALVERTEAEYRTARERTRALLEDGERPLADHLGVAAGGGA